MFYVKTLYSYKEMDTISAILLGILIACIIALLANNMH